MENSENHGLTNSTSDEGGEVGRRPENPENPKLATGIVLLIFILERAAYYVVFGNFYLFLNHEPFSWPAYDATLALLIFFGISCIASPFGGLVADFRLGRYWASIVSLIIYFCGYVFLPFLAWNTHKIPKICLWQKQENCEPNSSYASAVNFSSQHHGGHRVPKCQPCEWLVYVVLCIIAIGSGWFRSVIVPLGADQVHVLNSRARTWYFNWLYWCVNIGAFVSLGVFGYVQQSMASGFFWSYLVPLLLLLIGLFLIICSANMLSIVSKSKKSIFKKIYGILKEAHYSKQRKKNSEYTPLLRDERLHTESPNMDGNQKPSWLDMAKLRFGGKYHDSAVEDVKSLARILVVFLFMVPFWTIYYQMQTTFQAQGLHMRLNLFARSIPINESKENVINHGSGLLRHRFAVPQPWLLLFNTVFIIIFLPVLDRIVYPFLERRNLHFSLFSRMAFGMLLASLAMVAAGVVEIYRWSVIHEDKQLIVQVIGNTTYFAADMWVFWQAPQYALIGLSEIFTTVAGLEYAHSEAPKSVQGMIMGFFNLMSGIGSFVGAGLLACMKPLERHQGNFKYGWKHLYFFLAAGLQLVSLFLFVITIKTKLKPKSNINARRNDNSADAINS